MAKPHIPKWLAAEVDGEQPVGVAPENLFKRDLVGDGRIIKATIAICEGDCARTSEPTGDGRYFGWVTDNTGAGQHNVIINIIALQRS